PERCSPPRANAGSLMEVVRFSADAPEWLYRQMNSVSRVDNAEQGADINGDWITRDGYFRERRGARHIGVPMHEYAFGEAARQSRLLAVRDELKSLNVRILADEERLVAATREAAGLAEYLGGMDAIRQLDSRADEFAALESRKV
ncbi:chromosome segregation protein SMC, partial [Pseudomonas sp. MWU13-2860]